ncbi:MAG: dioxygenase [Rickettsiaceae bacterium]|nr:MAG: dioxygenase [Rickettsiaceae bacterium]
MINLKTIFYIVIFIFCGCTKAASAAKFYKNKLNHCKVTAPAINNYEPEEFWLSNNLLRAAGELPIYCGEKIIIKGRLLDQKCSPISDAKIYMWQAGCDGKYPYLPLRNRVNKNLINTYNRSTFKGSGVTTTNNLGEFLFITIKPHTNLRQSPYVSIRAKHHNLGELQTNLVLSSKHLIDINQEIPSGQLFLEETDIYDFDVIMKGEALSSY